MVPAELNTWLADPDRRPVVMGVLNVTPDSFSDGGKFFAHEAAAEHGLAMLAAGADWIDIGGESTRPRAAPISAEEQIQRVGPVIEKILIKSAAVISIDTRLWAVAKAAIDLGCAMVNDISGGLNDPAMLSGVAAAGAPIVLMHMQGTPQTMQNNPAYQNVTGEVAEFLRSRLAAARAAGVDPERTLLDPGIGFGKTAGHSLTLLKELSTLAAIGRPLVVGASRKSFIGRLLNEPDPMRRQYGDAAVVAWSIANGAAVVRVHDVGPMAQVVRTIGGIRRGNL